MHLVCCQAWSSSGEEMEDQSSGEESEEEMDQSRADEV